MSESNLRIYSSLSRTVEPFETIEPGVVRMYVCGVTPYDTTHMGHARTYVVFDTMRRVLEWQGYPVLYVQNVTDIDDDVLRDIDGVCQHIVTAAGLGAPGQSFDDMLIPVVAEEPRP